MTKKSLLITGSSSGIGQACAFHMRDKGWRVFASCRAQKDCDRLRAAGFDAPLIDYQNPETIVAGLAEVLEATGGTLDAVYQNGAFATPGAVEDLPTDALRAVFEANVFGWHELNRHVIPVMRAQGHGRIVHCSSVLGFVTAPWRGAYVASKFALEGLVDTLRIEMRDTPIHVTLIEPGPVKSKIRINSIPHFEKWIDWENSPRRAQYEDRLLKRLSEDRGPDKFELPPAAVAEKLEHALTSRRPKPRYFVTTPTYIMATLRRILSTRALDMILSRG
ncbi:MAG: SDR family NAD(P)-dependent oxidoreductase [Rhodobacteraceae bacterium]|nr:SDR family NAD(P)-dependent oxidoreductase [Paracoccaceae bacterium]